MPIGLGSKVLASIEADALRGSRRRNALRFAARKRRGACSALRSTSRLTSGTPSSNAARQRVARCIGPRSRSRRLVTDSGSLRSEVPSTDKRALTNSQTRTPTSPSMFSFLALRRSGPYEGFELDRVPALSRNRARSLRSERHLPESASSRKHEHNLRTSEPRARRRLFSAETLPEGCEPHSAGKSEEIPTGASGAPAVRAGERSSQRVKNRGQLALAERSRVAALVTPIAWWRSTCTEQPRLASNRPARTCRYSTNRERPGW